MRFRLSVSDSFSFLYVLMMCLSLCGCGLAVLPLRATGAVVKAVPVAGPVVAAPLAVTADTID